MQDSKVASEYFINSSADANCVLIPSIVGRDGVSELTSDESAALTITDNKVTVNSA